MVFRLWAGKRVYISVAIIQNSSQVYTIVATIQFVFYQESDIWRHLNWSCKYRSRSIINTRVRFMTRHANLRTSLLSFLLHKQKSLWKMQLVLEEGDQGRAHSRCSTGIERVYLQPAHYILLHHSGTLARNYFSFSNDRTLIIHARILCCR